MKRYFIVGTDTDCGKTYVTLQLKAFYPSSVAIKPVASGCMQLGVERISSDAQQLIQSTQLSMDDITPWRFLAPVSPHIAARQEGVSIKLQELADFCLNFQSEGKDTLFIEGAGGLMVPLNEKETWMDFLKITQIPVILVVGMQLGCINHAVLTEMALLNNAIPCKGWIANCLDPNMLALEDNIDTLKYHLSAPLLARVHYKGGIEVLYTLRQEYSCPSLVSSL